jgi:hypothetical protein
MEMVPFSHGTQNKNRAAGRWKGKMVSALCLLAAALLLLACQAQPPVPHTETASTPTLAPVPTTATAAPAPSATLVMPTLTPTLTPLPQIASPLRLCVSGTAPEDLEQVLRDANRLLAARGFNAQLDIVPIEPLGYHSGLLAVQASAQPCDIFTIGGGAYSEWASAGRLLLLDGKPFLANAPAAVWESLLVQPPCMPYPGRTLE